VNFIRALREEFPRLRLYKALPANSRLKEALMEFRGPNAPDCILVDSAHMEDGREKMGGTGRKSDWTSLAAVMSGGNGKWIIAGGLTPQNVVEAIQTCRPFGVDVVSGVERSPGEKDPAKLKAFVQAVRDADRNHQKNP
jgi:phosphoribosylanthranilate isomerase